MLRKHIIVGYLMPLPALPNAAWSSKCVSGDICIQRHTAHCVVVCCQLSTLFAHQHCHGDEMCAEPLYPGTHSFQKYGSQLRIQTIIGGGWVRGLNSTPPLHRLTSYSVITMGTQKLWGKLQPPDPRFIRHW